MSTPATDSESIPVIAIDGPTASGKGTVAQRVAAALGYHYLDSGALYRLVAYATVYACISPGQAAEVTRIAAALRPQFQGDRILLDGRDVTEAIRSEDVSRTASQVAVHPGVRAALDSLQKSFRVEPGLVADGRDMGTVVFPDARLKVFLTASVEARAERRYKQLIEKGFPASMPTLLRDLKVRDDRDSSRAVAPLKPAPDARVLESSSLGVAEVVAQILAWYREQP